MFSYNDLALLFFFSFYVFQSLQDTREELLYGTRATAEILNCVDSPHPSVRDEFAFLRGKAGTCSKSVHYASFTYIQ